MNTYQLWSKALTDAVSEATAAGERLTVGKVIDHAAKLLYPSSSFDASDCAMHLHISFQEQCKDDGFASAGLDEWEHPELEPSYVGPVGPSSRSNKEVAVLVDRVIRGTWLRDRANAQDED